MGRLGAVVLVLTMGSQHLMGASIESDWTGAGGDGAWENPGNWTPDSAYPNNGGGDVFHPYIENGASSLEIETSSNITLSGLTLTQGPGGTTALVLGGDMTLSDASLASGSGVFNTSGTNAGVVFDLNGHTFSSSSVAAARHNFDSSSYTVKSSAAGGSGIYAVRTFSAGSNVAAQDAVTVRFTTAAASSDLTNTTWSADSTLQIAGTGNHTSNPSAAVSLGNLLVGDTSNTSGSVLVLGTSNLTVLGTVVLQSYSGAVDGAASRLSFSSTSASLRVGGNFTDHGTDSSYYGSNLSAQGTISFVGGTAEERVVSIGRQNLRNHFRVGDAGGAGNIALANNLSTVRSVLVQGDSRLNLETFTLNAGSLDILDGATLALEIGGLINVTGDLSLNAFHLELLGDWSSWQNGEDLQLVSFGGVLTGTPDLASLLAPPGFSYDDLVVDGGSVYLSNVVIPEPSTVMSLVLAAGLSGVGRRRNRKKA